MPNRSSLSNAGIHVYGVAAIAIGLVGLVWADFANVWQPVPAGVPQRTALAYLVALCFLGAGLGTQRRRTAPAALLVLAVLYLASALLWLPRVIGFPRMIGTWSGLAEEVALMIAAVVACAAIVAPATPWAAPAHRIGRVVFGACVVLFGLAHFGALRETAAMVPKWIPPGQRFWAIFTGIAHLLAGIAIMTGVRALLAARLLTAMIVGFALLVWAPSFFSAPHQHITWAGNAINLAELGAAWIVADAIARRGREAGASESSRDRVAERSSALSS